MYNGTMDSELMRLPQEQMSRTSPAELLNLQQQVIFCRSGENMMLLLEAKDAQAWDYKGEGAANVIMAYHGSSPPFIGKVLRIKKVPVNSPKDISVMKKVQILSIEEQSLWSDWQEVVTANSEELLVQAYALHVLSPLLGLEHVDPGTIVSVSKGFLEALQQNIYSQRPTWRIETTSIDLQSGFALLISDHSLFSRGLPNVDPCVSIEIKPKCGFLPSSRFISAENQVKKTVSRFAMHQHLKLEQQQISCISNYSPLDLFSESRDRIYQAIKALFETPQNNVRIFLNGSLVLGGLGGYAEHEFSNGPLTDSVAKTLEDALEGIILCQKEERVACFQELVTETLYKTRILSQLLALQKMDLYDIEGAIHAYYNIIGEPCNVCSHSAKEAVSVPTYDKNEIILDDSMKEHTEENYAYLHSLSLEESRKIVRDYLISATAKDCSLMLSFQPVSREFTDGKSLDGSDNMYLESTRQEFCYKAFYVDLDLKRLKKMVHYYKLDQSIVSCYIKHTKKI